MTNPLANNPDAPNLGKLDPDNYTPDEFWKAFFLDMDILQPGAGEWTRQMLISFWQNKDKLSAACKAALERMEKDPELQNITGTEALQLGASIVLEEYERLFGEKPAEEIRSIANNTTLAVKRGKAEELGALLGIAHASSFSSENFMYVFTAKNIFLLPDKACNKEGVIQENFTTDGQLNTLAVQQKDLLELDEINTAFLMDACTWVANIEDDGSHQFSIYLPSIGNDAKIDGRTHSKERDGNTPATRSVARANYFINAAAPFDRMVGMTPNGSFYRLISVQSYDAESEIMTFSAPYLFKLKEMAESERPHHSVYNKLFHADILTEPNTAAVELANRILTGVVRRGEQALLEDKLNRENEKQISMFDNEEIAKSIEERKKVIYRAKYSTLISDCPQVNRILQEILDSDSKTKWQAYNSKLKQIFEAAYRIIMEKSDAPQVYEKFKLPTRMKTVNGKKVVAYDVPTKSTINSKMIITHYGRKKNAS